MAFAPRPIPPRAGVGLKPEHYADILGGRPDIGWFEIHAENYMGAGGPPHRYLGAIREHYPLSLHGVGLSIGGARPLDRDHLERLKALDARYQPALFSEHLAWSSHDETFLSDLLPVPYDRETSAASRITSTRSRKRSAGACFSRTPRPTSPSRQAR